MFKNGLGLKTLISLFAVVLVLYLGAEYLALQELEKQKLKVIDSDVCDMIWTMDYTQGISKTYTQHLDSWSLTIDNGVKIAEVDKVNNLLSAFSGIEVVKSAVIPKENLAKYGLDKRGKMQVRFESGSTTLGNYFIGNVSRRTDTVSGASYSITFIKEAGKDRAYEVKGDLQGLILEN